MKNKNKKNLFMGLQKPLIKLMGTKEQKKQIKDLKND